MPKQEDFKQEALEITKGLRERIEKFDSGNPGGAMPQLQEISGEFLELMSDLIARFEAETENLAFNQFNRHSTWSLRKVEKVLIDFENYFARFIKVDFDAATSEENTRRDTKARSEMQNQIIAWISQTVWLEEFIMYQRAKVDRSIATELHDELEAVKTLFGRIKNLEETRGIIEDQQNTLDGQQKDVDQLIGNLGTLINNVESFDELAQNQKKLGRRWLYVMIAFLVVTAVLATLVFTHWSQESWLQLAYLGTGVQAIGSAIQRLAILAIPLTIVRICLTKFNGCWHLAAVYQHRNACLKHFHDFELGVKDEAVKSQFRLELARLIFDDPATGLVKDQKEVPEFNIGSVIGKVPKM